MHVIYYIASFILFHAIYLCRNFPEEICRDTQRFSYSFSSLISHLSYYSIFSAETSQPSSPAPSRCATTPTLSPLRLCYPMTSTISRLSCCFIPSTKHIEGICRDTQKLSIEFLIHYYHIFHIILSSLQRLRSHHPPPLLGAL